MTKMATPVRAILPAELRFTPMSSDDDLKKRALARTDEELFTELEEVIGDTRRRLIMESSLEQRAVLRRQLEASERARDRIAKRIRGQ